MWCNHLHDALSGCVAAAAALPERNVQPSWLVLGGQKSRVTLQVHAAMSWGKSVGTLYPA